MVSFPQVSPLEHCAHLSPLAHAPHVINTYKEFFFLFQITRKENLFCKCHVFLFIYLPIHLYRVIQNYCRGHTQYIPDVTTCDFLPWGYVEDQVYAPPLPASIPELKVQIRTAIETITADMVKRTRLSC